MWRVGDRALGTMYNQCEGYGDRALDTVYNQCEGYGDRALGIMYNQCETVCVKEQDGLNRYRNQRVVSIKVYTCITRLNLFSMSYNHYYYVYMTHMLQSH